jgi:serine/threonine protein kinase
MIGKTLGHYRIESKLGAGGMGVVYRALDLHLDRPVAIKVLSPDAIASSERKQRFVQEAKAASALGHPNIITVHDIDTADGLDFIAMEYVPGKTLDQIIPGKGLRLRDALKYAVQIADALAKAHAAGIVHRDVKPPNIMVTDDGLVKMLDFGLAKLTEHGRRDNFGPTQSVRAEDVPRTEQGTILGTVAYMSPEQAEGIKVDARSDIFSFGTVLYEMVTGCRPFEGKTRMSILTAILREEPRPISEVAENSPRDLEKVIARCLRKDPSRRYQHMDDLKLALEELKEESDSGQVALAAPRRTGLLKPALAGIILLLAGAGGMTLWLTSHRDSRTTEPRLQLTQLTRDSGLSYYPALSPDGKLLAYASDRSGEGNLDIWLQQVARGGEPLRVTRHDADDDDPSFLPDSSQVVFHSTRDGGGIWIVPAFGGNARLLAKHGREPACSPDGQWVAYSVGGQTGPSKIYLVPAAGGTSRQLETDIAWARAPVWSPDGKYLLVAGNKSDLTGVSSETRGWWLLPVAGGKAVRTGLKAEAWVLTGRPVWMPGGNRVLFGEVTGDSANLWQVTTAPGSWQIQGEPRRLTSGTGEWQPTAARDGRVAFSNLVSRSNIWSLPIDANRGKITGALERVTQGDARDMFPTISTDGTKLVFTSNRSGDFDVWLKDLTSGKELPLTVTPTREFRALISPDASKVAYLRWEAGKGHIYVAALGGGGEEKVCDDCPGMLNWTPDGKKVVWWGGQPMKMATVDVATRQKVDILRHPQYNTDNAVFSSDSRWLTFVLRRGPDSNGTFISPVRNGVASNPSEWIEIAATQAAARSWFSPDGTILYLAGNRDGFNCIWAQRLDPSSKRPVGPILEIMHFHELRRSLSSAIFGYAMTTSRLYFAVQEMTSNIWLAEPQGH